jgi:hypothetical protein
MAPEPQIRNRRLPGDLKGVLKLWLIGAWVLLVSKAPADPDLWGHVRFGRDLLASGRLHAADPYSFTSDRPWINHEWLSEGLMAVAFDRGGAAGLNFLRLAIVGAVLFLVWQRSRIVAPAYRSMLVALAAIGITLRALPVRPQLLSLVCFAAVLSALTRAEDERRDRWLLAVPPVFAVWVNLHGGWIVGLATLGLWTVASLVQRPRERWWALPAVTIASALATLVNPYGARMWAFIYSTVGLSRPAIGDWLPLYAMPPGFWLGWLVAAGLCVAAFRHPARVPRPSLAVVTILGLAAIKVSRLDAFFCLAAVFLLPSVFPQSEAETAPPRPASRVFPILAAASAAAIAIVAVVQARHLDVRPDLMPEAASVDYIHQHQLSGRFLTWFDWGQFAIWHLADGNIRVSMDGRRETVYSDAVFTDHLRFYYAQTDACTYAQRIEADYAWLPIDLPAVKSLEAGGWSVAFKGPVSVILRAPGRDPLPAVVVFATAARDFPGP